MTSPFAIDTNVAVYAFSKDEKRTKAMSLLNDGPSLSIQLLNEFVSVSLKKRQVPWPEIETSLELITVLSAGVRPLDEDVHELGKMLAQRYRLGFYDSLMVAAACLDACDTLYSEDMQHGLIVDDRLTIINPFLDTL